MMFSLPLPKRVTAVTAVVLGLFLLTACSYSTPPLPPLEPPPPEATEAEAEAPIDGQGGYLHPAVIEPAPAPAPAPLGTSWGETISSSVGRVRVSRTPSVPVQVMNLRYSGDAPSGRISHELQLLDRSVRVRVLRDDGTPYPIYQVDGAVHLQGEVGARYRVEVTNDSSEQTIEVALAVDGVAATNGRPAKPWGNGFVIRPGQFHLFEGFRKNDDEVAAFRFSDVGDSVAIKRGSGSASDAGLIELRIYKVQIKD